MSYSLCTRVGKRLTSLHVRVAALVALLVIVGTAALAAVAAFAPVSHSGANGSNHIASNNFLNSAHFDNQPVHSRAVGLIDDSIASVGHNWTTSAEDKGRWSGAINQAGNPRWEVKMRTVQPVAVYAQSYNHNLLGVNYPSPSYWYRSEAKHLAWGMVNDQVLVWGGAHFHLGNGETTLVEVRWHGVSATQQIPYSYKRYAGGYLDNLSFNPDGTLAYDEQTVEFSAQDDSLGIIVDLEQETDIAHLKHRRYEGTGHKVWLKVNEQFDEAPDEGWIVTTVKAYDDAEQQPLLGTWDIY